VTAFLPTTRVTIQRGTLAANGFGDELPGTDVVASGIPAAVTEGVSTTSAATQVTYQPSSDRGGVVEEYTLRFRPDADVTEDDRVVDERTGAVYQIRSVFHPQSLVGLADTRCTAVRTGAASLPVNG
jgi:Phage head-tail joining protein